MTLVFCPNDCGYFADFCPKDLGYSHAAAEGRTGGRPPALSAEKMEAVRDFLENGGSVSAAARTFGVSRPTVRAVRDGVYVGQQDII